jgi:hypothetical protein
MRTTLRLTSFAVVACLVATPALPAAAQPAHGTTEHRAATNASPVPGRPTDPGSYITSAPGRGRFPAVARRHAAPVVVNSHDYPGVVRVVGDLRSDIKKVTGVKPAVSVDRVPRRSNVIIVGTIGRSPIIDRLVSRGRLDVSGIRGKWETSLEEVVAHPMPGVRRALVIAGSDQRGTIYGAYDVSRGIGVSPWSYWDDITPRHHDALYVRPGRHTQGTPAVKYRGFFINDEAPASDRWAPRVFGPGHAPGFPNGFNHQYYAKVFETMLRLKANYLWPAVWGRAFAEDDPKNHATATRYGVVMGTSHEAPMMRGIEEWNRHAVPAVRDSDGNIVKAGHDPYGGTGEWSFRYNSAAIKKYWAAGIRRMVRQHIEGVVTLGMRGNGDTSLSDGAGIDLMRDIIASQRRIIARVTGKDARTIPQVWTQYKEVQRYWDEGLRVPDDVTVVFTDDNWGNVRRVPSASEPPRAGGYGLYYHFDYVGGGRNYKWVDTASLPNVWDQLHQTYAAGDKNLWVTNVGDLKNNELPTQFFLDYAWNPRRWPVNALAEWQQRYATESFGTTHSRAIAGVLKTYGQLQSLRKPELLNRKISLDPSKDVSTDPKAVVYDDQATPFSLTDYRELDSVTARWQQLAARAERIAKTLPASGQDPYYELVLYEVKATANLYAMRQAEFTNLLYAQQGRASTNHQADLAEARFTDDQKMNDYYNNVLAGGKWKGFQTQPHIDYGDVARYGPDAPWQQPQINNDAIPDVLFPAVKRLELPQAPEMGVAIDGSSSWWPQESGPAVLPTFSPAQSQPPQYIDVFNRGATPFDYRVDPSVTWLHASHRQGTVDDQIRSTLQVDWTRAPRGTTHVPITVTGPDGHKVVVQAVVDNPGPSARHGSGFVESNGYVSINADHFTRKVDSDEVHWLKIPGLARTGAGMEVGPVRAPRQVPGKGGPRLEYRMHLNTTGPVVVHAYLSPRNNVFGTDGLKYAVSLDDESPTVVNLTKATGADDTAMNRQWERNTSDNVNVTTTSHLVSAPGTHVLRFWAVDPTVVLQKLVVDTGGLHPSYLGPPESRRADAR